MDVLADKIIYQCLPETLYVIGLIIFLIGLLLPAYIIYYYKKCYQSNFKGIGTVGLLILIISSISLLVTIFVTLPKYYQLQNGAKLLGCGESLRNVAIAIEMYCQENQGVFPNKLEQLIPKYLKAIPNCPAFGKDTYSNSYKVEEHGHKFTVYCIGHNHKGKHMYWKGSAETHLNPHTDWELNITIPSNYPQYNSYEGLILQGRD